MGLFNFRAKESKPATILQRLIDYTPQHYRTHSQFKDSVEYLEHQEWGLALDSLIELADESGDYFSEEFWSQLGDAADKMGLKEQADYCKVQIKRNEKEINSKTPFGWTTVKIDDTHFQHHISDKLKEQWTDERRQKDKVWSLTDKEGIHLKSKGRSGFIYLVDKGRIAEMDYELGINGLILFFEMIDHWTIPTKIKMTNEEKNEIRQRLTIWSTETRNPIEFH